MSDNPFFETWTTPFGLPPFDRIRPEHFPPAFDRAMAEHAGAIEAIVKSAATPTFANTIDALERSGRLLERVNAVFQNLDSSRTSKALQAIARDYAPKLARHYARIGLNRELFERIAVLHDRRDSLGLASDQMRVLERHHLALVRSGAALDAAGKQRMIEISERLATLHTTFGQNVLHDEEDWTLVLDNADLDGLPPFLRSNAAEAAKERGLADRYVITLSRSAVEPFLTFSARRDLRRTVFEAWTRRGAHPGRHDNSGLIRDILALRAEQARLLGFDSYAAFKFDDSMAKNPAAGGALLHQVWAPAKQAAAAERDRLQELARAEGLNEPIEPWDWRYYAEKVRQATFDIDDAEVKPYFVLDNMVRAAFYTAERLFGVRFTERSDLALYHPDVRAYEMQDGEGRHLGLFLQDNYARTGKHSGAWMSSFRDQEALDGPVTPIVVNNCNFSKGEPTLLGFDDTRTLFHEFGHALHGLLSRVRYPSQSGTAVRRDFVEFPSQLFEHWMSAPETLRRYAIHHQTGKPIPDALLERILAARNFNQGFATVEYTAAALLDLELHEIAAPGDIDIARFEADFRARIGMPPEILLRHRPTHFQHVFAGSGYAAGYYAYLWAETLDADGFDAFTEAGDVFDPQVAARLKTIYEAGDTRDPMDLYIAFRGHAPQIGPLLKQRGLVS
jgi:peptidyl-dipeptidase Dcp